MNTGTFIIEPFNGGIRVVSDTPLCRFRVEWDATGKLIAQEIEIRTPGTPETAGEPQPNCGCQQGKGEPKQPQDLTAWNQAMQEATTQP